MYGAVSTDQQEGEHSTRDVSIMPRSVAYFFEGGDETVVANRESPDRSVREEAKVYFKINPESVRFVAYLGFWGMCFFAIAMTKFVTADVLMKGPEVPGNTCPPFDDGKGFDIKTDSHLMRTFGFNNICSNWDYSPSREYTAMIYPIFEYSLLIYIILDFINTMVSYKKGYVGRGYWIMSCVFLPIQIVLCAWFRMIFIILAYVNVAGHTAGFLGLQICLIMVAMSNAIFVVETKVSYPFLGGIKGTKNAAYAYLTGDLIIGIIKVYLSGFVVMTGGYPEFAKAASGIPGRNIGQMIDLVWMIFNAILPLVISYIRSKSEAPLTFTVTLPSLLVNSA